MYTCYRVFSKNINHWDFYYFSRILMCVNTQQLTKKHFIVRKLILLPRRFSCKYHFNIYKFD